MCAGLELMRPAQGAGAWCKASQDAAALAGPGAGQTVSVYLQRPT